MGDSRRMRQMEVFKGEMRRNTPDILKQQCLITRINNKGGNSPRLNILLLGDVLEEVFSVQGCSAGRAY
jgi:hypothetical protein